MHCSNFLFSNTGTIAAHMHSSIQTHTFASGLSCLLLFVCGFIVVSDRLHGLFYLIYIFWIYLFISVSLSFLFFCCCRILPHVGGYATRRWCISLWFVWDFHTFTRLQRFSTLPVSSQRLVVRCTNISFDSSFGNASMVRLDLFSGSFAGRVCVR